ncbi:hypothetical protein, partial [Enterococcus thailandicus]|uniref:hypothetical protein n=1 Tax=Enterococcus thailandicus TaxID=417368 RepID=UPI00372D6181
ELFLEKPSYCLKLNAWRHNLIHGVPQATSSAISSLFLKIWGTVFRKAFLLLEAKRLAPQPYPRCSQNNSSI